MAKIRHTVLRNREEVLAAFYSGGIPAVRKLTANSKGEMCSRNTARLAVRGFDIDPAEGARLHKERRLPARRQKELVEALEHHKCVTCAAHSVGASPGGVQAFKLRHPDLLSEETKRVITSRRGNKGSHHHLSPSA